jgi:uncharacterized protein DUF3631
VGQPTQQMRPLDELLGLIGKYVVMTDEQRLVVALWVVHTYLAASIEQTPYLTVTSPEKQCGKSRLLETLRHLVARPWYAVMPSEAVVYRTIHQRMPTLLLDEVDAIFAPKTADRYEPLRAILNSGHRHDATVPRCVNFGEDVVDFRVYCPKVLAGIGSLPDTIADRSVPIRLQRKTDAEPVARFRTRDVIAEFEPVKGAIETWAAENAEAIAAARPELPDQLSDRMQEGCESLIAIADALGCGDEARAAFVELLTSERLDSTETWQLKLLSDLRDAFADPDTLAISTESLVMTLTANGWIDYGHSLGGRELARLLRPYGIRSKDVRLGTGEVKKGYHRRDLEDAWARYLPARVEVAS